MKIRNLLMIGLSCLIITGCSSTTSEPSSATTDSNQVVETTPDMTPETTTSTETNADPVQAALSTGFITQEEYDRFEDTIERYVNYKTQFYSLMTNLKEWTANGEYEKFKEENFLSLSSDAMYKYDVISNDVWDRLAEEFNIDDMEVLYVYSHAGSPYQPVASFKNYTMTMFTYRQDRSTQYYLGGILGNAEIHVPANATLYINGVAYESWTYSSLIDGGRNYVIVLPLGEYDMELELEDGTVEELSLNTYDWIEPDTSVTPEEAAAGIDHIDETHVAKIFDYTTIRK